MVARFFARMSLQSVRVCPRSSFWDDVIPLIATIALEIGWMSKAPATYGVHASVQDLSFRLPSSAPGYPILFNNLDRLATQTTALHTVRLRQLVWFSSPDVAEPFSSQALRKEHELRLMWYSQMLLQKGIRLRDHAGKTAVDYHAQAEVTQ